MSRDPGSSVGVRIGASALVCLTVFLGADLLSLWVEGLASPQPRPLTAPPPPTARSQGPGEALGALRQVFGRGEAAAGSAASPGRAPGPVGAGAGLPRFADWGGGGGAAAWEAERGAAGVQLQGIMVGGDVALAVLEVDGEVRAVPPGGGVGGYLVEAVEPDRVTLSQGGQTWTLSLARLQGAATRGALEAEAGWGDLLAAGGPPPGSEGGPDPLEEGRAAPQAGLQGWAAQDPGAALLGEVRAVPAPGGVRVQRLGPGTLLEGAGLRDGDEVLAVNGEPVRLPEDLYNAFLILRHTPSVEFRVRRGGQELTVQARPEEQGG